MDESDSDSDSPQTKSRGAAPTDGNDLNKYPVDGLFISHAEKAEIMAMREIEREQKIAERREEMDTIRQNMMLRHLASQPSDNKKRKANAADLEESTSRKATRVRTKGDRDNEPTSKIDSLRRAREERKDRIQQRELENDRRKRRSPSYRRSMSRDSGDGSDVEWADTKKHRSRTPEQKETPEAELRDVERIRVGRTRFAEVCFYPGFEEALTGCYVRINIGPDRDNMAAGDVYRMAVIKGLCTPLCGNPLCIQLTVRQASSKARHMPCRTAKGSKSWSRAT
jgi:RNA polymerase-associated protein RTF1